MLFSLINWFKLSNDYLILLAQNPSFYRSSQFYKKENAHCSDKIVKQIKIPSCKKFYRHKKNYDNFWQFIQMFVTAVFCKFSYIFEISIVLQNAGEENHKHPVSSNLDLPLTLRLITKPSDWRLLS